MSFYRRTVEVFGADSPRKSVLFDDGERHLCSIVDNLIIPEIQGERLQIVEVGCCRGVSASILARYGHVISFDVKAWGDFERVLEVGEAYAMEQGIHWHGVERRIVADTAQLKKEIASLPRFHLAHEDGSHRYADIEAAWPEISKCNRVIFHDYDGTQPDVTRFVNEQRKHGRVRRSGAFAYWHGYPKVEPRRAPAIEDAPAFHAERGV